MTPGKRPDPSDVTSIPEVRAAIDAIDDELMGLIAERLRFAEAIVPLKAQSGVSAAAPARANEVLAKVRARAEQQNVDPAMAEAMWRVMIEAIIAQETRVLGTDGEDA